jgi:cellulose biosynthesis protein BcsQ/DNA-binding XRE family transcriptional regulator
MSAQSRATPQRARLLRLGADLTQEQLAEKASVSVETVQRLERTGHVSVKTIAAIARALGVDASEIKSSMGRAVVACMSEKGGVGRTTLTFNLSVLLASLGNSVCAIQVDECGILVEECHVARRRPLPKFSSCWMPDADVIDDLLASSRSYSHIIIDGSGYRPEVNEVLIAKADLILVPIVHPVMEEPALDSLMAQITAKRGLSNAPIVLVFNQCWPNDPDLEDDLRKIERRYGCHFPNSRLTRRKTFTTDENGSLFGPLNSPVLTPRAREAKKACQELAQLWNTAERTLRRAPSAMPAMPDTVSRQQVAMYASLPTIRSRRQPLTAFGRALRSLATLGESPSTSV